MCRLPRAGSRITTSTGLPQMRQRAFSALAAPRALTFVLLDPLSLAIGLSVRSHPQPLVECLQSRVQRLPPFKRHAALLYVPTAPPSSVAAGRTVTAVSPGEWAIVPLPRLRGEPDRSPKSLRELGQPVELRLREIGRAHV